MATENPEGAGKPVASTSQNVRPDTTTKAEQSTKKQVTVSKKQQPADRAKSARLHRLIYMELLACVLLCALATCGLLLRPRLVHLWLPAVVLLLSAICNACALLALDQALAERLRPAFRPFCLSKAACMLLNALAVALLVCNLVVADRREALTRVWLAVLIVLAAVAHVAFGMYTLCYGLLYSFALPSRRPQPPPPSRSQSKTQTTGALSTSNTAASSISVTANGKPTGADNNNRGSVADRNGAAGGARGHYASSAAASLNGTVGHRPRAALYQQWHGSNATYRHSDDSLGRGGGAPAPISRPISRPDERHSVSMADYAPASAVCMQPAPPPAYGSALRRSSVSQSRHTVCTLASDV